MKIVIIKNCVTFLLMPGESKAIAMRLKDEGTHGEKPEAVISGYNLSEN